MATLHEALREVSTQLGEVRGELRGVRDDLSLVKEHAKQIRALEDDRLESRTKHRIGYAAAGIVGPAVWALIVKLCS